MGSLSCLIKGLELLSNEDNMGTYKIEKYDLSQYMRLDRSAIDALNILPNPREPNQKQNLFGLLNVCKTAMGSRKLMQWIKQPLLEVQKIEQRLDYVDIFVEDTILRTTIRGECFKRIPDLERIAKKMQRGRAGLQDCVIIYQFISMLPLLENTLRSTAHENSAMIESQFAEKTSELRESFDYFVTMIDNTIDLSAIDRGEFLVKPEFHDELRTLHKKMRKCQSKIDQHSDDTKRLLKNPTSFKLLKDKTSGHFFKITQKDKKILSTKTNSKKYEIIFHGKQIKFTDGTLKKLTKKYTDLQESYNLHSATVVQQIMDAAKTYIPVIEEAHELISDLDVLLSFATVSTEADHQYVRPEITEMGNGDIILQQARHPVLEAHIDTYIPNDCFFKRGESSFQIITGPNMGGKSTFIRSVGLNVLLAQIGCFVACSSANITLVDAILARVGAGDSQLRGVSTFMAEMLETSVILKSATRDSLIIIDELGRGTSTYDGFGLAWAISEHICTEIDSFCFFATHFHELTQLEENIPDKVKNYHVTAFPDEESKALTLLYELQEGASDQSFGIHVAKLAAFPQEVIDLAVKKANQLENFEGEEDLMDVEYDKDEKEEGEQIIDLILREFSEAPLENYSNEELAAYINNLKDRISRENNSYINNILAQ
eukprot:TRINITY_DN4037_c0_g2_i1.p1 TRINITY_DN4037_c0_g2~~TRINITY_DN4037_c0_g2_i1.p1  ORF type:complete len:727 (+),score=174.52 TRINITY_DN4037_c0_g2_i1:210-2183(+)